MLHKSAVREIAVCSNLSLSLAKSLQAGFLLQINHELNVIFRWVIRTVTDTVMVVMATATAVKMSKRRCSL